MYIPKSFAESDSATLYQFMQDNNFAALVTEQQGQLMATHLPFLVDIERGLLKAHLARAAVESMAYQTRDVLDVMQQESGINLATLKVDGGASANNLLMQFQSDLLGVPVRRPPGVMRHPRRTRCPCRTRCPR